MVAQWHEMLAYYLSKPPNIDDLEMLHISLPTELIGEIRAYYLAYRDNPTLEMSMIDFYDQIEPLIQHSDTI